MGQRMRWLASLVIGLVAPCAYSGTTLTTVDSVGLVGEFASLQLNAGNPVISYYDTVNGDLKLATCTANCQSATPTWVITTVDSAGDVGKYTSLQLNGGNPVISYLDNGNSDLKLATCTANCQSATPTWVITTVESAGFTGFYTSLQLNGGNPVISYSNDDLKLATCTANCQSAAPTWVITTVDSAVIVYDSSLQLNAGNPVISYYDASNRDLKLATCTANCQSATPTWIVTTVESAGEAGDFSSLRLNGGNPVISYHVNSGGDLKLATCTANCQSATPTWVITTVDSAGFVGFYTSMQLDGGSPVISYYDSSNRDLKLATCTASCQSATPTWVLSTLDSAGDVGIYTSLQINGGQRVIGYFDPANSDLKLATVTPPTVAGITRAAADPTAAASVSFTVTFSEAVTGVDAADFALTAAGLAGASVTGVSGAGTTWTVTVGTGAGSGTLRLDLTDDDSIVAVIPLGGAGPGNGSFTAGESYTLDRTGPAIAGGGRSPDGNYATGQAIDVNVTYDEAVNVDTSGGTPFVALTIGATTRNAAYASGSGTTTLLFRYLVQASDQDLDGIAIANNITANGATLRDALGNNAALAALTVAGSFPALRVNSDVTPDAFSFIAASGQPLATLVTSNTVTINGIDFPVAIGVSGGEYSIGCTASFTALAGTIPSGGTVCVRNTTSAAPNALTSTVLTVGAGSATFSSTTGAYNVFSGPSATGGGTITASFTGGGATCNFSAPQFIGAPPGSAPIPPTSPGPGFLFPHGLFDFSTTGCTPGSTLSFTIVYPASIAGASYWKYGPTLADPTPHWYVLLATITGNTATFTITDGGLGDDDLVANGTIVDQGGPGLPPQALIQVPTLDEWGRLLLALSLLVSACWAMRRRSR